MITWSARSGDLPPRNWRTGSTRPGSWGRVAAVQYGIPAETDAQFLFYNLTWGLELGFNTPPKNRADFLLQSCKAQKANLEDDSRENNGTGGWLIAYDSASLLAWLSASDSPLPAGAPFTFDLPETRSVLDYLKNLEVRDCSWLGKAATPYEYFTKRYALMVSGSLAEISRSADGIHARRFHRSVGGASRIRASPMTARPWCRGAVTLPFHRTLRTRWPPGSSCAG